MDLGANWRAWTELRWRRTRKVVDCCEHGNDFFFLTLTEGFPCFFLSSKVNARVKLAKTGHGPHPVTLFVICVVLLLFVLFYILFVYKCVLPSGDNPTAVNKYIKYRVP
jgi:hypothetical protein